MLILTPRPVSRFHYCALCASDVDVFHDFQRVRCTGCLAPVEALLVVLGSHGADAPASKRPTN